MDIVDEQIDVASRGILGLTVSCARCHDHKFDPISQKDYFQLFAFFHNVPEVGNARGSNAPPALDVCSEQSCRFGGNFSSPHQFFS